MKCELCHIKEAQTAIQREGDEELYVCDECAKRERLSRKQHTHQTHKISGLPPGIEMSVTQISGEDIEGDDVPPFVGALMNAFQDMVSDMEKSRKEASSQAKNNNRLIEFPTERIDSDYQMRGMIHLEGLHLMGGLESAKQALKRIGVELRGVDVEGLNDAGHAFRIFYSCDLNDAKQAISGLLNDEANARKSLVEELPRVFEDAICRALAIAKSCRLLTPCELFDVLSPLRLASIADKLDGITFQEIEAMIDESDLSDKEGKLSDEERDRIDGMRADEINQRFEEVEYK